jgi:predicted helicase
LKQKLQWPGDEADAGAWRKRWASAFVIKHREVISTSKALATRLAELARDIRHRVNAVLEVESEKGPIRKLHAAFKQALIHDLSEDDFADMYAQTIAYGLLLARVSRPAGLVAENLVDMVPVTNPFLQELLETFLHVGGRKRKKGASLDFDELGVTEVVEVLRHANMEAVLRDFGDRNPQEDPVIHFYEDFLKEYDSEKRTKRGVFYTPRPVVSFIVRSVHELLQTEFGLEDGLADTTTWGEMAARHPDLKIPDGAHPNDPFVCILDPATGTATFLVEVIDIIYKTLLVKWTRQGLNQTQVRGAWNDYVPKYLLPRLHGYELMMAPYAIAHMKIGLILGATGYRFGSNERVRVYLTNALEPAQDFSDRFEFDVPALAHEAQAVNEVKRHKRFTVVVGNPPYANFGQLNKIPFILDLLEDYKRGLDEKKINLDDDYIKFVRLGHHLLAHTGCGMLGLITNNTFVDAPTRREMRHQLISSFDSIWVLDLHGNSIERETCPDGSPDENVFDIQQGVAISFLTRSPNVENANGCRDTKHAHLYGLRAGKYVWLHQNSVSKGAFTNVVPSPPLYLLQPYDTSVQHEYERFIPIPDVLCVSGSGVKTDRDDLCFDMDRTRLQDRMRKAFTGGYDSSFKEKYRLVDSSSYDLTRRLTTMQFDTAAVMPCLYRLFDQRWLYYQRGFTSRPAWEVMQHMLKRNLALLVKRQARDGGYDWFFVSQRPIVDGLFSIDNKGREQILPLYLYEDQTASQRTVDDAIRTNFHPTFLRLLCERIGLRAAPPWGLPATIRPEGVFHYAYAVFHSPLYRARYVEFLKTGFPRLPLTSNLDLFRELARLGGELVALHLVEASAQQGVTARYDKSAKGWRYEVAAGCRVPVALDFKGPAEPVVEKVSWSRDTVWLDKKQTEGFHGVREDVWDFHIGGYQVCEKWLKDRKGRTLTAEDITHYHRIVIALHETIRIMQEIDDVIEQHGGWPGAFVTAPPQAKQETGEFPFV